MSFVTIAEETRTARKPHRCIWCGQVIDPGSRYVYVRGVFEGDPQSNHYHPECSAACVDLAREEGGDCDFMPYENERPVPPQTSAASPPAAHQPTRAPAKQGPP